MITKEAIINSIPEECNKTLEHVQIHLDSAIEARNNENMDQYAHDADLAARLLLCIVWDIDKTIKIEKG